MGDSFSIRLRRRVISIPAVIAAAAVGLAAIPIGVPILVAVDLLRGRRALPRARAALFAVWYLGLDALGALCAGVLWIRFIGRLHGKTSRRAHTELQGWWAARLATGARALLGLRFDIDHPERLEDGPVLCLARHACFGDALLPALLSIGAAGRPVRYVLMKELVWSPSLDLVGHRLPNHFVDRDPASSANELAAVARLAEGLDDETIAIFPEGRFFTPDRRRKALERLHDTDPATARRAARLQRVLPPRPGGTLALLEASSDLDVVVVSHVGLERLGSLADIWRNVPLRAPVRVRVERFDAAAVPTTRTGRIDWLHDRWEEMDDWIQRNDTAPATDQSPSDRVGPRRAITSGRVWARAAERKGPDQ